MFPSTRCYFSNMMLPLVAVGGFDTLILQHPLESLCRVWPLSRRLLFIILIVDIFPRAYAETLCLIMVFAFLLCRTQFFWLHGLQFFFLILYRDARMGFLFFKLLFSWTLFISSAIAWFNRCFFLSLHLDVGSFLLSAEWCLFSPFLFTFASIVIVHRFLCKLSGSCRTGPSKTPVKRFCEKKKQLCALNSTEFIKETIWIGMVLLLNFLLQASRSLP